MIKLNKIKNKIVCIYGPTASYKTKFAISLAKRLNGIVINADSMQLYKEMPILTSHPTIQEQNIVPHKMYNILNITSHYSVFKWIKSAIKEIEKSKKKELCPILVGGTGLYFSSLISGIAIIPKISQETKQKVYNLIKKNSNRNIHSLLQDYDYLLAKKISVNDRIRVIRGLEVIFETGKSIIEWQKHNHTFYDEKQFANIYICPDRDKLYFNINKRVLEMMHLGVENEVNRIINKYAICDLPKVLGLKTIHEFIIGRIEYAEMILQIQRITRNYAKKQLTWFNNKLKHNYVISDFSAVF